MELCGIEDCALRGVQAPHEGTSTFFLTLRRKEVREKRPRVRGKDLGE